MTASQRGTLVICIGNEKLADHAAGCEVYRRLAPIEARLALSAVGGAELLPLLDGEAQLILVEAVELGAAPGTVHVIPWHDLSRHGARLSEPVQALRQAIEIGSFLSPELMPPRMILVGIEARCFDASREGPTPEVAGAIEEAVAAVRELVRGRRREGTGAGS